MLNVTKAKNLKGEVGSGQSDTKIWSKAKLLYDKANLLATANGISSKDELKGPAESLATAVGESEAVEGLRKALKELKNATDTAKIVKKAKNVVDSYDSAKSAYNAVKAQETQYNNALGGEQSKYTAVTTAFTHLERAYNANCKTINLIYDRHLVKYCMTWPKKSYMDQSSDIEEDQKT